MLPSTFSRTLISDVVPPVRSESVQSLVKVDSGNIDIKGV
jgi:hypothetical protein